MVLQLYILSGLGGKELAEMQETRFHSWVRRSPGRDKPAPLKYSCLEVHKVRGARKATLIHRKVKHD